MGKPLTLYTLKGGVNIHSPKPVTRPQLWMFLVRESRGAVLNYLRHQWGIDQHEWRRMQRRGWKIVKLLCREAPDARS